MSSTAKQSIKYLASLLLFGSNGIVAAGIALPSHQVVLLRTFLGAIALVVAIVTARRTGAIVAHPRQTAALAVSGAALGIGWLFLFEAYNLIGVGVASLAYYCGPVIVMLLSPLLFGERLTAGKLAGFAAVITGCFLVVMQGGVSLDPLGLALGGLSAVMYAVMVVFSRKSPDIVGLEASAVQIAASFAVVALYQLGRMLFSPAEVTATIQALAHVDWVDVLMLGLVNTGVGCYLYFSTLGELPVQRVAVWGYLEPLSAVIMSALILNEALSAGRILGAVLIVGGAIACELLGKGREDGAGQAGVAEGAYQS